MKKLKKNDFILLPGEYLRGGGDYARVVEIGDGWGMIEWFLDGAIRTSSVKIESDSYELVSDNVNGWLRRTHRKGPFKLYDCDDIKLKSFEALKKYTVIFKNRGKVHIGAIKDRQYLRYGISTFGVLSAPYPTGLWQTRCGAVSEDQLAHMVDVWYDTSQLPDWHLTELKGLTW